MVHSIKEKGITVLRTFFVILVGVLIAPSVHAQQEYKTSYLSFKSDILLNCAPTKLGTTLCIPKRPEHAENMLITFAAKIPGPQDNLKDYKTHLKEPQTNRTPKGKEFKSQVNFLKEARINNVTWIDALHKEGELENYYTRYFATVYNGVAVVFTVTIDAKKYPSYALWLRKLSNSLKVSAVPDTKEKTQQLEKEPAPTLPKATPSTPKH